MVACSLSALAVRDAVNYRAFFFWTLLPVWFIGFICFLPNIEIARWSETLITGMIIAFTNGFLTSISALMIIFFLELVFNVTTNMSLLLLADNHPLLERLKREAPGTYFHSMMVATLAEDAAKAIGANAVRAKCGALYHDIGKLSKPQYFTENNLENHNQHTDLNPQVSSIIIRDHVKEGLVLARKYKLNRVIRNAIEQHHGNDLVHYFYNRAMLDTKNGSHVDEGQFRYQGDLPQDKEMVIISLADACEAAVRSLEKPSVQKIEMMVDEIFKKLSKYSPMQESVCINSTEAPFYSWLQPIIDKLERIKHGVEKEKEILEIEIKKVKKAKFVNICISIVVVFACIFGSVCLSFATINHYREQMNAELEKNNAELLDFKQKFMHIDEINDGYNDLLSSYINVSNSTLLRYSDDSISFTANLTWLSEEYNVVIQEDAKYIVMTNDDKVFEYDVFDKNYNRTANTLGKNFEMSGALSKYIFNEVSDVNSVTYIKLVGVKLTKSDISQALIKENLEIELYNK